MSCYFVTDFFFFWQRHNHRSCHQWRDGLERTRYSGFRGVCVRERETRERMREEGFAPDFLRRFKGCVCVCERERERD